MRAPLTLPKGNSTVQICGLEVGNSYKIIAVPMGFGQRADFEIAPAPAFSTGTSSIAFMRERKNAVSFSAPNDCVEIQVMTTSTEQGKDVPMFLSIRCETCPEANAWLDKVTGLAEQSILEVEDGFSAEQLIEDVLVGGGCFQISDVTFSGQGSQIGTFSNGLSNIGFNSGVILATGNISIAPGPNDLNGAAFGFGINTPDPDLANLTTGSTYDMANIEFDFVPTQSQVSFEFVFASEEYCEYVNTKFNDVFGFFISGPGIVGAQNLAVIPTTSTPITINNVNHMVNAGLYTHNTPVGGNNCQGGNLPGIPPPAPVPPATGPAVIELQYDGFTKKMTATATVVPCQKYHIKLKIADVADGVWDSAVFLRANSFDAGGEVLVTPAYPGAQSTAYEGCSTGNVRFKRGNADLSQPLVVNFAVAGTATPGVDYVPINSPIVIPAGQSEMLIPINVIPDALTEGTENILLTVPNACSCTQGTIEFLIKDRPVLTVEAADQFRCIGEQAILQAAVSNSLLSTNYSYLWSTGETTPTISPTTTGTYNLTVTDGCSTPATASINLIFTACSCASETFIKTLGDIGQNVRGYGIYDSKDGNLYVTGLKQDSAAIIKMTPTGTILWMRTFDVRDGANDHISELLVDSEGMLVGCGQSGDFQPGISGFVFRYNPNTNNIQWLSTYGFESAYVMGLVELPNGNYLIYDNPHQPTNDNRMLEITRPDGTIEPVSPLSQKLNLGGGDNFNSATIHNGKLYGAGRYTNGDDFTDMRHTLSRIDLATGNVDWTKLSHVQAGNPARIYGKDLLIEEAHIISVSYGSETNDNLGEAKIFLQKNNLDGDLLWIKRINIPEAIGGLVVEEVVSVPDGFILYAFGGVTPNDLYLIKTDKNGELKWSKKVDFGFDDTPAFLPIFQSQILAKGNHLYFMATRQGNAGEHQMVVSKTTLDGTVEGDCDFIKPVLAEISDVTNPANFSVLVQNVPFEEETVTLVREPKSTILTVENQCEIFVEDQVNFSFCPGDSVIVNGVVFTQPSIFTVQTPGNGGCDTLRTYVVEVLPQPMGAEEIILCPGDFVILGGQVVSQAGIYVLLVDGLNGDCDTMMTYTITTAPYLTRSENISFCPGNSVTIGGQVYTQSGVVMDTLTAESGCDTIVTYTLTVLPYQTGSENVSFCPGSSVTIGGQVYTQSGIVVDTILSAPDECPKIVTYTLTVLPQPTRSETITFCPGETITLGGVAYNQPGTVILTLASSSGACDTIATYTLQFSTPAPSVLNLSCPGAITISQPSGSGAVVTYNLPTATSDCVCPGIAVTMTSGLPSGSTFPAGTTSVCYAAKDSCGQTASCCFNITIEEDDPCDTKVNGCIKYELLTITEDMGKNRTYRIRVTNNCANKLIYTAIQIPDGLVAIEPENFSTYTAPSGNTYKVRSPNFSPQYSVRFSSIADSINNGESDIFKYTIPAQANNVLFINVVSRLAPYVYLSAHLNTFYCPIGVTPADDRLSETSNQRNDAPPSSRELGTTAGKNDPNDDNDQNDPNDLNAQILLFPNPTSGELFADFSYWQGQRLTVQVLDSRGQRVQYQTLTAIDDAQKLELPGELPNGLYFLEVVTENGAKQMGRFVVQR
ncbi:MAG: choice-of-anchor L domain-containing protein [Saprospiraceae bacterium]